MAGLLLAGGTGCFPVVFRPADAPVVQPGEELLPDLPGFWRGAVGDQVFLVFFKPMYAGKDARVEKYEMVCIRGSDDEEGRFAEQAVVEQFAAFPVAGAKRKYLILAKPDAPVSPTGETVGLLYEIEMAGPSEMMAWFLAAEEAAQEYLSIRLDQRLENPEAGHWKRAAPILFKRTNPIASPTP